MSSLPTLRMFGTIDEPVFQLDGSSPRAPFIIGVCGGTASGKTTVCHKIIERIGDRRATIISMDCFYKTLTPEQIEHVKDVNFDHPDAFDYDLIIETITLLRRGLAVDVPVYDFKTHRRDPVRKTHISGVEVVIFEGILTFYHPRLLDLYDMKLFVDTDSDLRLIRRIRRDMAERARSLESVLFQYETFVKPSFEEFTSPLKKHADVIIPRGGDNEVAIDLIVKHLKARLLRQH